ncbi:MAG TPA: MATE family efflux transporter [Ignavibacteriaceae bacterium]|jgi:MATE family multidrug resistance protein|nr:MAG: Multidrug resistance protein NorM [Ignavibacteria bacterium ADurb.Bin266]OQY74364.1 MAG: MATE family efflux transporter [Ignavibacteriales bacterium UTCHB2]HQF42166.1 MATE family efflux transporter [Ignavibacteriaceae bacterium]HQI40927.1 MATE family efflux transporter [Ignavibacteriaceae bacterium]
MLFNIFQKYKDDIISTFKLAYPVMIGQLGIIMMGVVDSIMVGSLGSIQLAAASLGNSLVFLILIIGIGSSAVVTPLIAILLGAKRISECGVYFRQSLFVNIVISIVMIAVIFIGINFLGYLNQPTEVIKYAVIYMGIVGLSALPLMIYQTYKQFIEGFSIMKPAMIIALLANIINAFTNWILIFGKFGFPALGLAGAAWATFASRIFMAVAIIIYVLNNKKFKDFDVRFHFRGLNFKVIKKILQLGVPSGFQHFFEVGAFSIAVIMIGWIGANELAAHQIALNLASITFMIVLGISQASSIRVGYAMGERDVKSIRRAGFTAITLGASIMSLSGLTFVLLNRFLPSLYIDDQNVIEIASRLLIIAALFQLSDGTQAVGIGVLRGLTDIKGPTIITFTAYWIISLPVAYLLAFVFKLGVEGIWIGLLIGLTVAAVFLTIRFNYKSKKIIQL